MAAPLNEFTRRTFILPPKRGLDPLRRFTYGLLIMAKLAGPLMGDVNDATKIQNWRREKIVNCFYSFCKEVSSAVAQS